MALSFNVLHSDFDYSNAGFQDGVRKVIAEVTGDASHQSGGEAFSATDVDSRASAVVAVEDGVTRNGDYNFVWNGNQGSPTIQAWNITDTTEAAAANTSTSTAVMVFWLT